MRTALSVVCSLIFASGTTAGDPSQQKSCGGAVCRKGSVAHAASEHLLLQHGKPALNQGSLGQGTPDGTGPEQIYFDAVVRDFTASHPDFQSFDGHVTGLVEPRLGTDGKPVFHGGSVLSTQANFDQWYHDIPGVNRRLPLRLELTRSAIGTYAYESSSFFPIDGLGWGDEATALDGKPHNFYFTLELKSSFVYRGGEMFHFRGDDDVWVFINGELVIDLGGVHNPIEGTVELDALNLEQGATVDFSFFFAERRCCGSNFRLETSIQFPAAKKGTCVLWGDPHVSVFDRSLAENKESVPILGFYTSGDFWLVKSSSVSIQGRYGPTRWTAGQGALLALAVSGPFLRGHTLIIEPMENGMVSWDGEQILEDVPSEFFISGFVNVTFHGDMERSLIDPRQGHLPLRTVTARLPKVVDLIVNRWPKHIDAIIKMRPLDEGQDGHCGNFNMDPLDDTKELILERAGAEVPAEESLFGPWPESLGAHGAEAQALGERRLEDCAPKLRAEAERLCKSSMAGVSVARGSNSVMEACVFDVCFGGKEFAAEDAAAQNQLQDE